MLCTAPGTDFPTDPQDAPVVSLLAVAPDHQGHNAGKVLLEHALTDLARQGHSHAVLHVFADNPSAVRLYERTGWQRLGDQIMIDPLGKRPSWTYSYPLNTQQETVRWPIPYAMPPLSGCLAAPVRGGRPEAAQLASVQKPLPRLQ